MERILIVGDDCFFREVFSDLLTEDGYQVEVAASGKEALKMIRVGDYQLVVSDLVMYDLSGLEILSAVKRIDPTVDVIMVTEHANVETAIYALKNGALDYLIKPINHNEFRHIVAHCMEQRRLFDENKELKALLSLFQVSQTMANCLELERIYPFLIDALAKEVGVSRGLGYFCGGGQLTLREVKGFDGAHAVPLGQAVIDRCELDGAATDNLVILRNFLPQEGAGDDVHEAMCLYIRHKSILQGVIMLFNDPEASLPKEVVPKRITFLLDQAALALDNAGRYNLARDMLYVDELTDLYNYRYLDVVLERELKRAEHCGTCLSVLFLDIDFFKVVNDMYGHLVGSAVLKEMGAILRLSVRDVDAVIRYGGDEYTIVLVETGLPGAELAAERIRTMVEAHTFGNHDGLALKLTVSLGYACWPVDAASKKELMAMADRAMYRGKAGGKNRALHAQSGSGSI